MSSTATVERDATQRTVKAPGTRLLDLLAGWERFVGSDEEGDDETAPLFDSALDSDEIAGMYQAAAAEVLDLNGRDEAEAVRRWVLEKILPAILR